MQKQLIKDIKAVLEFYGTLGFERLPITVKCNKGKAQSKDKDLSLITHYSSQDKETALSALRKKIGECNKCKLSKNRTHIVFGEGNPYSRLMFIGEAPGKEEDVQARPFVGDAGMLLTRLIEKMGFRREDVYIANIVKCRPPMNRDPEKDEIEQCRVFVERQVEIIHPEVIICLGRISAQTLIGNAGLKISAIRGKFYDYRGIPLMPTFHPAYLIRNPKDKWLTWEDVQKVLQKLKSKVESKVRPI